MKAATIFTHGSAKIELFQVNGGIADEQNGHA